MARGTNKLRPKKKPIYQIYSLLKPSLAVWSKFSSNLPPSLLLLWWTLKVISQQKEMLQTLVTSSKTLTARTQTKGAVRLTAWVRAGTSYTLQRLSPFSEVAFFFFSKPDLGYSPKAHASVHQTQDSFQTYMVAKTNATTIGLPKTTAARPQVRDSESAGTELKLRNLYFKNDFPSVLTISQVWEALIQMIPN